MEVRTVFLKSSSKVSSVIAMTRSSVQMPWIATYHSYLGALPPRARIGGLRLRCGDIQVGGASIVEDVFAEPRFNAWCVGELHVIDDRIVPNGRRDHFEQNAHLYNLLNQLGPLARS